MPRVAWFIQVHADIPESAANLFANGRCVFANSSGKHDRIKAAKHSHESAEMFERDVAIKLEIGREHG